MTNTVRIITSSVAWAVLAAPALAHPGHGEPMGHTHNEADSLSGEILIFALIAVGVLIALRFGSRALSNYTRQS